MGIFKAYDIRGLFPSEIDEDVAERIGKAVAQFLKVPLILVGRDMRLSGKSLNAALIKGIIGMGVDVMDIGLCSTPMCYFACAHLKAPASVMVTASHNPPQYNGFKLTREGAIPISGDTGIQEIEKIYSKNKFSGLAKKKGIITAKDIKESYKAHVLSFIAQKALKSVLEKKKIVVDAANGMGSLETSWILEQLPCRLVKLFCSIDGSFPNHEANPLKEENTRALQDRVLREKADLGIAFDGDADRVLFIDERGSRIPTDLITCLIARDLLRNCPHEPVLYDIRSSWIVPETVAGYKGTPIMTKVGHAFIKEHMRKVNGLFAGELSGHYYYRENFFTDSAIITALKVIGLLCGEPRGMSQLVDKYKKYFDTGELNLKVDDKEAIIKKLERHYPTGSISRLDGIRIDFKDWWFNVRPSNTEPLLRVVIEARASTLLEQKKKEIFDIIDEAS